MSTLGRDLTYQPYKRGQASADVRVVCTRSFATASTLMVLQPYLRMRSAVLRYRAFCTTALSVYAICGTGIGHVAAGAVANRMQMGTDTGHVPTLVVANRISRQDIGVLLPRL